MSILIKGREIPTRCADCLLEYDGILCRATGNSFIYRSEAEGGYVDFCDTRMPDCPLVEVPEDVAPVVHGKNLDDKWSSLFKCSICHWSCWDTYCNDTSGYDYCPNCGAKMDGGA